MSQVIGINNVEFSQMIEGTLRDDQAFNTLPRALRMEYSTPDMEAIVIPQAGTDAEIVKNNNEYPATISQREDTPHIYTLDVLEVKPRLIQYKEQAALTYNKAESILREMIGGLGLRSAREVYANLYHKTTGMFVETTGADIVGHAPGVTTGEYKSFTFKDLQTAVLALRRQGVSGPLELIADSAMVMQLLQDIQKGGNYNFTREGASFVLPALPGITVHEVINLLYTDASRNLREVTNTTGSTTDKAVALLVSKPLTSYVLDSWNTFVEPVKADYYGALYSASTRFGSKYRRLDKKGVMPIIQAAK